MISRIIIDFPKPVAFADSFARELDRVVGVVCARYEKDHPGRIMWPAGQGSLITYMPMTRAEEEAGRHLEFDDSVHHIECAEREAYPEELKRRERSNAREEREETQLERLDANPRLGTYYHGHDRGVVVTQENGKFTERPMTIAELVARHPAAKIHHRIREFATYAAFAYILTWELIVPAIEQALAAQSAKTAYPLDHHELVMTAGALWVHHGNLDAGDYKDEINAIAERLSAAIEAGSDRERIVMVEGDL